MPSKSRHVRGFIDTKVYTKARKIYTEDDAGTWYGRYLGQGGTIDIFAIA